MIVYENTTYQDKSELIYCFLKKGKSLGQIGSAIDAKTDPQDVLLMVRQIKYQLLITITEDSWLFNTTFEFFEFVSMYVTVFHPQHTLDKIIAKWIINHQNYIFEYKEEHKQNIQIVLNESHRFLFNYLLFIFQNYLSDEIIIDLYSKDKLKDSALKQILDILGKSHLYNHYIFMSKLNKQENKE